MFNPKSAVRAIGLTAAAATVVLLPQIAAAEPITWDEAVSEAARYHPDLAAARETVNQSRADRTQSASALWPQVSADVSGSTSEMRTRGSSASDSFVYGISGRQLIFDGFKSIYEVQSAVDAVEASDYAYLVTSSEVRLSLRRAYVNLWRAQELIGITERIADRRRESRDLIKLRYEAGREHQGSLLTAEANLAQAEFEVQRAHRGLATAQRSLTKEMGRKVFDPVSVPHEIPAPVVDPAKPDFEEMAARNPFLLQLAVLKEAARWGAWSALADFFPTVYADASTGRRGSRWEPETSEWSAGASASVTLFDGWGQWAGLDKARSTHREAEAVERGGKDGLLLTLEETWAGWQNAAGDLAVQEKFLEAARERAQIAAAEYGNGLIAFNDWIIIENNLVQADKAYLDARAGVLIAEADWRQAKGETLNDK